jgi:hypothetical protein
VLPAARLVIGPGLPVMIDAVAFPPFIARSRSRIQIPYGYIHADSVSSVSDRQSDDSSGWDQTGIGRIFQLRTGNMEIMLGNKPFELTELIGTVVNANKMATQQTHVSGGGGVVNQGYGSTAPVSVTTTTTIDDKVFLMDGSGQEYTLRLTNVDIAVRPGHELHCIWAARKGKEKSRKLVGIFNRNTQETDWLDGSFTKLFRLSRPLWAVLLIAAIVGFGIGELINFSLVGYLLPGLIWYFDRRNTAAAEQLKSAARERFRERAGERIAPTAAMA